MKVQCSCGAKCEFAITPEMAHQPLKFVCPACGLDASEFVDGLVRQELGQSATPSGVPVPVRVTLQAAAAVPVATPASPPPPQPARPAVAVRVHARQAAPVAVAPATVQEAPRCLKHLGELATEKCYVCGKPICPQCMDLFGYVCSPLCKAKADSHGIAIPVYAGQRNVVEAAVWRKVVWSISVASALVLLVVGVWFWYSWFGCLPKTVFSVRFEEKAYSGESFICGRDNSQIVFLHGGTLARHDMALKKPLWSRDLVDHKKIEAQAAKEIKDMEAAKEQAEDRYGHSGYKIPSLQKLTHQLERWTAAGLALRIRGQNVWVSFPDKLVLYDWDSGNPIKETFIPSRYGALLARGDELLLVNNTPGNASVTHINLANHEMTTEIVGGLPSQPISGTVAGASRDKATAGLPLSPGADAGKPMDPAKVAEQAQHLSYPARLALPAVLANSASQERTLNELDGQPRPNATTAEPKDRFSLISSKDGFVQFSSKLVHENIVERDAMQAPPKKSALDSPTTVANSTDVANEILNDMQRARGGGTIAEDLSRYQVKIRRSDGTAEWKGEVVGEPTLYPLESVNVLTARKLIVVFDKSNKKLWQSALTFDVHGSLVDEDNPTYGLGPCVERKGVLYVYDEGVLTAFDLMTGNARWRLPSVGVAGLFFDDHDMIYINSTTASLDSLKYSRQINLSQKVSAVVHKVDSKTGKVLWTVEPGGLVNYVSGKFIYTASSYMPPDYDDEDMEPVQTGFETSPYMRLRRISPSDGHELWEHFQPRAPLDVQFDKNTIRFVFKKEVQVLRTLSF